MRNLVLVYSIEISKLHKYGNGNSTELPGADVSGTNHQDFPCIG
jgi:hypothetical protein